LPGDTIQALLIDDETLVREGLGELLRATGMFTGVTLVGSAAEAHHALERARPDIVVTDLILGEGPDGIQLAKAITSRHPSIPVLLLSGYDEALFAEQALEAGASGFVMKEAPVDQLLEAIKTVMDGRIWVSTAIREELQGPTVEPVALRDALGAPLFEAIQSGNRSVIGLARALKRPVHEIDRLLDETCRVHAIPSRVALLLSLSPS